MLLLLALTITGQFFNGGATAFTGVPYNTPLGYQVAVSAINRNYGPGYWAPPVWNPKIIVPPKPVPEPVTNDFSGKVLDFNSTKRELKLELLDGEIVILRYHPKTIWLDENGEKKDLEIHVGRTFIHYNSGTIKVL